MCLVSGSVRRQTERVSVGATTYTRENGISPSERRGQGERCSGDGSAGGRCVVGGGPGAREVVFEVRRGEKGIPLAIPLHVNSRTVIRRNGRYRCQVLDVCPTDVMFQNATSLAAEVNSLLLLARKQTRTHTSLGSQADERIM